jgi:hypothetical protein
MYMQESIFSMQVGTVEPWQMTKNEFAKTIHQESFGNIPRGLVESVIDGKADKFIESKFIKPDELKTINDTISSYDDNIHKSYIRDAIAKGKPVPPEVLKDYPELTTTSGPVLGKETATEEIRRKYAAKLNDLNHAKALPIFEDISPENAEKIAKISQQVKEFEDKYTGIEDITKLHNENEAKEDARVDAMRAARSTDDDIRTEYNAKKAALGRVQMMINTMKRGGRENPSQQQISQAKRLTVRITEIEDKYSGLGEVKHSAAVEDPAVAPAVSAA